MTHRAWKKRPKGSDVSAKPPLFPPRIVSGIQPSTEIHLGHYFGALKQHIQLHHEYPGQAFFLIADYHALTRHLDPKMVRLGTIELATTYLALGLDPNKAILYRQSDIPEYPEMAWILSCLTPASELIRNPPFRAEFAAKGHSPSMGLMFYPVLMAADIIGLRGTLVPVGSDQAINVERVRDIAKRLNRRLGARAFPIPDIHLTQSRVVPGTDGRKMSAFNNNHIRLFERFDILQTKINSIRTAPKSLSDPKDPDKCTLFQLYALVAPKDDSDRMRVRYQEGPLGYQEVKRELTITIQEHFSAFNERYETLKRDPDFILDVLREGFRAASHEAKLSLSELRHAFGIAN
ncbi:tryptophan--tRNA ligase [bacterium AH-315-F18]|nr:tryptophan--tRNA ligase [bacterium AH-315-F18]